MTKTTATKKGKKQVGEDESNERREPSSCPSGPPRANGVDAAAATSTSISLLPIVSVEAMTTRDRRHVVLSLGGVHDREIFSYVAIAEPEGEQARSCKARAEREADALDAKRVAAATANALAELEDLRKERGDGIDDDDPYVPLLSKPSTIALLMTLFTVKSEDADDARVALAEKCRSAARRLVDPRAGDKIRNELRGWREWYSADRVSTATQLRTPFVCALLRDLVALASVDVGGSSSAVAVLHRAFDCDVKKCRHRFRAKELKLHYRVGASSLPGSAAEEARDEPCEMGAQEKNSGDEKAKKTHGDHPPKRKKKKKKKKRKGEGKGKRILVKPAAQLPTRLGAGKANPTLPSPHSESGIAGHLKIALLAVLMAITAIAGGIAFARCSMPSVAMFARSNATAAPASGSVQRSAACRSTLFECELQSSIQFDISPDLDPFGATYDYFSPKSCGSIDDAVFGIDDAAHVLFGAALKLGAVDRNGNNSTAKHRDGSVSIHSFSWGMRHQPLDVIYRPCNGSANALLIPALESAPMRTIIVEKTKMIPHKFLKAFDSSSFASPLNYMNHDSFAFAGLARDRVTTRIEPDTVAGLHHVAPWPWETVGIGVQNAMPQREGHRNEALTASVIDAVSTPGRTVVAGVQVRVDAIANGTDALRVRKLYCEAFEHAMRANHQLQYACDDYESWSDRRCVLEMHQAPAQAVLLQPADPHLGIIFIALVVFIFVALLRGPGGAALRNGTRGGSGTFMSLAVITMVAAWVVCSVDAAQQQTVVRWVKTIPGDSCTTKCTELGRTCNANRMNLVNTNAIFEGVQTAMVATSGASAGLNCTTYSLGSALFAPCVYSGVCSANSYASSTCAAAYSSSTGSYTRLCCCLGSGENAATVCPVQASDCDAVTMWDSATSRCVDCPSGWYQDASDSTNPICKSCGSTNATSEGKFSSASGCVCGNGFTLDVASTPPCVSTVSWVKTDAAGDSCDMKCNELGRTCDASQMNAVNTNAIFEGVQTAMVATSGASAGFGCTTYSLGSALYVPCVWSDTTTSTVRCEARSAAMAATCAATHIDYTRLCCCIGSGENAATVCPVQASDCRAGTWWDNSTKVCTHCAVGKYDTIGGRTEASQCTGCVAGKYQVDASTGNADDLKCIGCVAGKFQVDASTGNTDASKCTGSCAAGKFQVDASTGNTDASKCNGNCSSGKWSAKTGLTSDDQCEGSCSAGKWSADTGLTSDDQCEGSCSPGKHGGGITGLTSASECVLCAAGLFSGATGNQVADQCAGRCDAGKYSNFTGLTSHDECKLCESNFVARAGQSACEECTSGKAPDTSAAFCDTCAIGEYKPPGNTNCITCPTRGAQCSGGIITLDDAVWYSPKVAIITADTEMHKCFNDEACIMNEAKTSIVCNAAMGYSGALCGACDRSKGAIRSGAGCAMCWEIWQNYLATVGIALAWIVLIGYYTVCEDFDAEEGEYSSSALKMLMSHLQMLGVLGIFKAKGTAVFNSVMSRPAELVGGSVTSAMPVKCALDSQAYGTFLATMALPLLVPIIASAFLTPMVLISRCTVKKRNTEPIPTFNGRWGIPRFLARWRFLREPMDAKTRKQWREPVDFVSRLVAIQVFMMFTLYPALIGAVASMLNCTDSILGKQYLLADLSVTCYEGLHNVFIAFAAVGGVVYCVGIPIVVYLVIAWKSPIACRQVEEKKTAIAQVRNSHRSSKYATMQELTDDGGPAEGGDVALVIAADPKRRERRASVVELTTTCKPRLRCRRRVKKDYASRSVRMRYGFLFNGYETDRATDQSGVVVAWEAVVMVRKLFVTLAAATISDAYLQILAALLILIFSVATQAYFQPYEPDLLDALDTIGLLSLLSTQVLSILYVRLAYTSMRFPPSAVQNQNTNTDSLITLSSCLFLPNSSTRRQPLDYLSIWAKTRSRFSSRSVSSY